MPGQVNDFFKDTASVKRCNHHPGRGLDQIKPLTGRDRFHEGIGNGHTEIEVVELGLILLCRNKVHDIGVINTKHTHIGPAPLAALLDGLGGRIKDRGK